MALAATLVAAPAAAVPIVEYTFADGNSATATNTGTLAAAMDGPVTGGAIVASPFSPDNQAISFSGPAGISMPNGYDFGSAFTVEMLFRVDIHSGGILFDDFGGPGVYIQTRNPEQDVLFVASPSSGDVSLTSGNALAQGTWYHVAGVYDGANLTLYINGIPVASEAATGGVQNHPLVTPSVGIESGLVAFPWNGAIDDFRIHDTAIQVSQFNGGNPLPVPEPGSGTLLLFGLLGARWFRRG